MSWKRGAREVGRCGAGCLIDVLMWMVVAPVLGVFIALAVASGDPAVLLGVVVFALLLFGLYLLASWDD